MSFVVGTVSGALVAGAVYYGFSDMIKTRTEIHRSDLQTLSQRLLAPPTAPAPLPAAARIVRNPFGDLVKSRWNSEIEALFRGAGEWDRRLADWGRNVLYGGAK